MTVLLLFPVNNSMRSNSWRVHSYGFSWGIVCQKQLSGAWTRNYIPQYLWDVITCPHPWYLFLAHESSYKLIYEIFSLLYRCRLAGMVCFLWQVSRAILCNIISEYKYTANTMMTSSNGSIFLVTGHLCGKFTGPRWISSFDVFFDLRLNKRLSKQPWGWWFETLAWSLWRHRNAMEYGWGEHLKTQCYYWYSQQDLSVKLITN